MKTKELTGIALDWAIAKCERAHVEHLDDGLTRCLLMLPSGRYSPSANWAQGGPIIERESIQVCPQEDMESWAAVAMFRQDGEECAGATPLIAAMRCHVASKLGDEIDLPKEIAS